MTITKQELEERINAINYYNDLSLSIEYFNGLAWLKSNGNTVTAGTKNEISEAIICFMAGYRQGIEKTC